MPAAPSCEQAQEQSDPIRSLPRRTTTKATQELPKASRRCCVPRLGDCPQAQTGSWVVGFYLPSKSLPTVAITLRWFKGDLKRSEAGTTKGTKPSLELGRTNRGGFGCGFASFCAHARTTARPVVQSDPKKLRDPFPITVPFFPASPRLIISPSYLSWFPIA